MRHRWIWIAGVVGALILLITAFVRFFVDKPLRQTVEHNVNLRLDGYAVRISALKLHPVDFSHELIDPTIIQTLTLTRR